MRIAITGGAGFVGSNLGFYYRRENPSAEIVAVDNLKRRGADLNVPLLRQAGINFVHGDIRKRSDLEDLPGDFDLFIEASAEPSVLAGTTGSPNYVLDTNLNGTLNCLEFARRRTGSFVFLSTSRVYSISPLRQINMVETSSRFEISDDQNLPGLSTHGISEDFPTNMPRSFYGASKLASELIIQEYQHAYRLSAVINRCGVIMGPGQFGKSDQGVFTLWLANHFFHRPLRYTGFGGKGKQVRDLLHPYDLFLLIKKQLSRIDDCSGEVFNVGGGKEISTSLLELTELCRRVTGNEVPVHGTDDTTSVDIPLYISDCRKAAGKFDWQPERSVEEIVNETYGWLKQNEVQLRPLFTSEPENKMSALSG